MAEVMVFHHALGRTAGVLAFADRLRAAGHTVVVPDLYEGRLFTDLDEGVAFAEAIGMETIIERGVAEAAAMPADSVFVGFSLGALPAQKLAQTRAGTLGAILLHGGVAPSWFGDGWPTDVAVQVHASHDDPWVEREEMFELIAEAALAPASGQMFSYPGDAHLFTDSSLAVFDAAATDLVFERIFDLFERIA